MSSLDFEHRHADQADGDHVQRRALEAVREEEPQRGLGDAVARLATLALARTFGGVVVRGGQRRRHAVVLVFVHRVRYNLHPVH